MGARTKLNSAYLNGCLLIAAALGLVSGSWPVFAVAAALGVAAAMAEGTIRGPKTRPSPPRHEPPRRRPRQP